MTQSTTYIGDSVYLDILDYGYEIYTNNGLGRNNVIFLEPEVLSALITLVTKHK